jgi:hypothetical protein
MNRKPVISLYASAARPENWLNLYDSIKHNSCEFEIVFVGPNSPKIQLPKQFKFIKSFTKPVQCAEIAARNAEGEFLLHCVDDLTFKDKNALDKMLEFYNNNIHTNNELILSPKLMRDGKKYNDSNYKLYPELDKCPYVPISIFIKKSLYFSLGGYDLNFIASFADTDLAYRGITEMKAQIEFVETFVNENKNDAKRSTLFEDYMHNDLVLLKNLWFSDEGFLSKRAMQHDAFSEVNILGITQGKKGRWGYTNKYIEKIFSNRFYYLLKAITKKTRHYWKKNES